MKILVIANHVLSSAVGSGGDKLLVELAWRWQKNGHQVHLMVAALAAESIAAAISPSQVTVLKGSWFDDPKRYQNSLLLVALVYLRRAAVSLWLARNLKADIVYTPGDFWCDVVPAAVLRWRGLCPVWATAVFHINQAPHRRRGNSLAASSLSWIAQRASLSLIKRLANIVFALNRGVKDDLIKRGFIAERIKVQGAGIEAKALAQVKPQPIRFAACYLGRINPSKGVLDLPMVWAEVVRSRPGSQLLIMGGSTANWDKQLRQAIKAAGVAESIVYQGYAEAGEVYQKLKECQVFVSASYEEGFGMSVAEAMALGLPAAVYDLPAYREFFAAGLTRVPVGDKSALARAIVKLLLNKTYFRQQQEAAVAAVASYDWDNVAASELAIMIDS